MKQFNGTVAQIRPKHTRKPVETVLAAFRGSRPSAGLGDGLGQVSLAIGDQSVGQSSLGELTQFDKPTAKRVAMVIYLVTTLGSKWPTKSLNIWDIFVRNFADKIFLNRPIWSHCYLPKFN